MTTVEPKKITISQQRAALITGGLLLLMASLIVLGTAHLPSAVDWRKAYRPAVIEAAAGGDPYEAGKFHNPPWSLLLLAPFAADLAAGRAVILLLSLIVYALTAYHMGAKPIAMAAFLLSPPVLHTLLHGNVEWMVFIGLLLPPRWGLFFITIKPQVGLGVAIFWAAEAWREGGWRRVVAVGWPVTLAYLISFALYGLWPFTASGMEDLWWNASFWPYSIPVGLAALVWAIYYRDIRGALIAAPCLSPYVLLHAWSGALLAVLRRPWLAVLVVTVIWLFALRNA